MQLSKSKKLDDLNVNHETEILMESDSLNLLKEFGYKYSQDNGYKNRLWIGDLPTMGNDKLVERTPLTMYLSDTESLHIQ